MGITGSAFIDLEIACKSVTSSAVTPHRKSGSEPLFLATEEAKEEDNIACLFASTYKAAKHTAPRAARNLLRSGIMCLTSH